MSARGRIRCAQIVATSGATGVERHLEALLAGFDPSDVAPVLIVPGPGPLVDRARARGIEVAFGAPSRKLAFAETRQLAARLASDFDLAHAHGPRALFWARRAAAAARVPVVATIHELRRQTMPPGVKRAVWVALEERDLARVDARIAVSEFVRRESLDRHPSWADSLEVVHGTTPLLLDPAPARIARAAGDPLRIVSIGRLEWVKRHETVLRVLASCARRNLAFRFTLLGTGPDGPALRHLARSLGVADRVRWVESSADVAGLLAESDVFLTASRSETLGLAALEALACGATVVGVRVGALPELDDGGGAKLVEPYPDGALEDRLAEALMEVAGDGGGAVPWAARAAARVRERFAPARLSARVANIYRTVLARRPRSS